MAGVVLSVVSQWQIGKACVLAGEALRRLAVPRDVKRGEHFTHKFVSFRNGPFRMAIASP